MTNRARLAVVACAAIGLSPAAVCAQASPTAQDLVGTWQLMTVKNLKTGEVDSVANHGLGLVLFTPTHVSFTFMENNRPGSMAPDDYARLSPADKVGVNYSRIWNEQNVQQFRALASTWHLSGNTVTYGSEVRLDPYLVGKVFREQIVRLDKTTWVNRTEPDATGVAREETLRRIK